MAVSYGLDYCCFLYYVSGFVVFQDCFSVSGPLRLYVDFRIFLYLYKKSHWDFHRDCIESVDRFGWYGHFNNIESFNPCVWDIFDLFVPFLSSLNNVT